MKIQFLGHASLLIETSNATILVDPFISGNDKATAIDINRIKADYILITHAHQDHILDVEYIGKKNQSIVVSNFEIVTYFNQKGLEGHPMNHGGSWEFPFGKLTYTNAIHSSSFPDGSYGGQPGGFVLEADGKTIYIAGDTSLTYDMKLLPLRHKIDLGILPIGDNFTMGIDDAITASDFIECKNILGYHFDTFGFIEIDHNKAIKSFSLRGKVLNLLEIGEFINL